MRQPNAAGTREQTGNHYVYLPDIRRADGALGSVAVLHRGLGGALAWSGHGEAPLLRPVFLVDGAPLTLGTPVWERLDRWVPRWHAAGPRQLRVGMTVCAPGGWGGEVRGAVLLVELENGAPTDTEVEVGLDVAWAAARLGVLSPRSLELPRALATAPAGDALVLELGGGGAGGGAALAVAGPAGTRYEGGGAGLEPGMVRRAVGDGVLEAGLRATVRVRARGRATLAFHLAVAPERDGAAAGTRRMRRITGPELLRHGRLELASLLRTPDAGEWAGVLNRNLLLAYFGTVARAVDDDRAYLVAHRDPEAVPSAVFTELEQLLWTLPALALLDAPLAREAMQVALELHAPRAGTGVRYMDGGVVDPAIGVGAAALWPLAIERYARDVGDGELATHPMVQDLVRDLDGLLPSRLHPEIFLASTEALLSGEEGDHPFGVLDNAVVAAGLDALDRLRKPGKGESPAPLVGAGEEVRAALWQHGTVEVEGETVLASSVDLAGAAAVYDDPGASLGLLPELGFCDAEDPVWLATMAFLRGPANALWHGAAGTPGLARRDRPAQARLAALCTDLLGPRREQALKTLAALDAPDMLARDAYDPATGALTGPPRPPLAGLLGWTLARALGERPPGVPPAG